MDCNLNLKIGDRVIRNYNNSLPTSIGVVVNITQKRGDYVVDYGNYKETYRYDGWQRGGDVWTRSHIQLLTPEIEERIRQQMSDDEKCLRSQFVVLNDGKTPVIPQVLQIINTLSQK